jgi:hypothetical protein
MNLSKFFLYWSLGVRAVFTARSNRDETWRGQGIRKRSVFEFSKTESRLTAQRRFRTVYHTEQPSDKRIHEWYSKLQQSGCLCALKRTGRPGPSAETVERVRETFVRSPQKSRRVEISRTCKVGHKLGVSLPLLTCSASE